MAGRVCLVNSVITSSFIYTFMIYRWPISLIRYMEKRIRNFIWTGSIATKKLVSISWKKFCRPLKGGLGIKSLRLLNEAMLAKLAAIVYSAKEWVISFMKGHFMLGVNFPRLVVSSIWSSIRSIYIPYCSFAFWLIGDRIGTSF